MREKFTSATETFIVNQIVAAKQFDHAVFTIKNLNNLPFSNEIYAPRKIWFPWQLKILSRNHKRYLAARLDIVQPRVFHTHYTTIKVLKSLLTTVNIKYRIVGSGPLKDNLKSFAEANGLRNNVEFHEAVKHGPAFLDNLKWAHVFLHPSNITAKGNKEGIPGTIVEAMASGLPVLSTVHAGIPEVIRHDVNGFLVQEKDYRAIAKYLTILYEEPALAFTIGQRAKEYACRNLDIHRRAIHLEDIYLAALASPSE